MPKARLVERVAAMLHEAPGVTVQRNVRLPSAKHPGRRREIDFLITEHVTGYRTQIAVECKNEKEPVGGPLIDAFVGKLQEINVPRGVFVSVSGYKDTVAEYAMSSGIVPLVLHGLTSDRLSVAVGEAVQSVIHLSLDVTGVRTTSDLPVSEQDKDLLFWFYDQDERLCGMLLDLVWEQWLNGSIPGVLGEYELKPQIPSEWSSIIWGQRVKVEAVITVYVDGLIVNFPGQSEAVGLTHGVSGELERWQINTDFGTPEGTFPVTAVETEAQLEEHLRSLSGVRLSVGRFRLPRIRDLYRQIYWPPSQRVGDLLLERAAFLIQNPSLRLPSVKFDEVEGLDMRTLWEPIWEIHPASQSLAGRPARERCYGLPPRPTKL